MIFQKKIIPSKILQKIWIFAGGRSAPGNFSRRMHATLALEFCIAVGGHYRRYCSLLWSERLGRGWWRGGGGRMVGHRGSMGYRSVRVLLQRPRGQRITRNSRLDSAKFERARGSYLLAFTLRLSRLYSTLYTTSNYTYYTQILLDNYL